MGLENRAGADQLVDDVSSGVSVATVDLTHSHPRPVGESGDPDPQRPQSYADIKRRLLEAARERAASSSRFWTSTSPRVSRSSEVAVCT